MNKKISFPIAITIIIACAVLVGGVVVWQYYGIPKEEEETSEEVPADGTADWKIYQSLKMGFSIKCPSDLRVSLDQTTDYSSGKPDELISTFQTEEEPAMEKNVMYITISMWVFPKKYYEMLFGEEYTFQDYINDNVEFFKSSWDPDIQREDFIIDENPAIKTTHIRPYESGFNKQIVVMVYTQKDERVYEIRTWINFNEQDVYLPIFTQMLSTFRFLE